MTDLERAIKVTLSAYFGPEVSTGDLRKSIMRIFDAHLKEDAEREDRLMDAYTAMDERDAELARLREELRAYENDESEERGAMALENARLREENKNLRWRDEQREKRVLELQAERDRLRSDLDGYMKAAHDYEAENARLREETLYEKWRIVRELKTENARLRADLDGYMKAAHNYEDENAKYAKLIVENARRDVRLREANDHFNEAVQERDAELARLRDRLNREAKEAQANIKRLQAQRDDLLAALREIERGKYEGYDMTPGGTPTGMKVMKRMSRKMMREHARVAIDDVNSREDE